MKIMSVSLMLLLQSGHHQMRLAAVARPVARPLLRPASLLTAVYGGHHFRHHLVGFIELAIPAHVLAMAIGAYLLGGPIHEMLDFFLRRLLHGRCIELSEAARQLAEHLRELRHPLGRHFPYPLGILMLRFHMLARSRHITGYRLHNDLGREQEHGRGSNRLPGARHHIRLASYI